MATPGPDGRVERVLVTGASGYIATHIVQQLQQAGYKVRGTVRSLTNPKKVEPLKNLCPNAAHPLELVEADLTNDDCWKDAVRGCSHVLHTASPFPLASPKNEDDLIIPAVQGTTRVLQACADAGGVRRVVVTSSCAAISDLCETNTEPITETQWRQFDETNKDFYGKSKTLAEKAAWEFVERLPADSKFELVVINPAFVIGPALCGVPGTSIDLIRRLMLRDPAVVAEINIAVCDVRDVAKAHLRGMLLPEAAGNRHIIAPCNLGMLEMAQILRNEFKDKGYKPPTMVAPKWLIKFMGFFSAEVKVIYPFIGKKTVMSDTRLREVLKITPYEPKDSLIDMAYSSIDKGFIIKKKGYYNPRLQQAESPAAAETGADRSS